MAVRPGSGYLGNISRETRRGYVQSQTLSLCLLSVKMAFAMLSRKALNVTCKATPKKGTSKTVSSSHVLSARSQLHVRNEKFV